MIVFLLAYSLYINRAVEKVVQRQKVLTIVQWLWWLTQEKSKAEPIVRVENFELCNLIFAI